MTQPSSGGFPWREPAARAVFSLLPSEVLCYVDTAERAFALTFDDGPDPSTTPALLDVLAEHSAHATFFLIGERVRDNEEIVARIAAEGHELAHVKSLLGRYGPVQWVRPGSGWFTPSMLHAASKQDMRIVLGTVAAMHTGGPGDEKIIPMLAGEIRPGTIVVLHEGTASRRGVVAGTDELLTRLGEQGLAAVTISELVAMGR